MFDKGSPLKDGEETTRVSEPIRDEIPSPPPPTPPLPGCPAHQRVLPALPGVKVHPPFLGAVNSRLHGGLGGHKDVNFARLDVLLRHPRQRGDVLGG